MNDQWYFSHAGATYGPVSVEEIKERIARKTLLESDWVWQAPADVRVQAVSVFDFSPPAVSPVPDWLADVVEVEKKESPPRSTASTEGPEWLEDLRLWIALEQYEPGWELFNQTADGPASAPSPAGGVPDWLASWGAPAASRESLTAPRSPGPAMAPPAPKPPISAPPVAKAPPPAAPTPPAGPPTAKAPPPAKPPAAPAPVAKAAAPAPVQTLAEKMREATGFDADTGQIIDPVKFAHWKQQQTQPSGAGQPAVSNASLFEVFRKGRTAIEKWVDDEQNRRCVMHADADEIKRQPQVQAILQEYANFGTGLQEKLLRHLEFMVENRRKYFDALTGPKEPRAK